MTADTELIITELSKRFDSKIDQLGTEINGRFELMDTAFADLASAMQYGFEKVYERFDEVDERFDRLEGRTNKVEEVLEYLKVEVRDVKTRVIHLESSMEEVQESLSNLENAEEKDAKATINHETRIQKLEKVNKIKSKPVAHLLNI